MNLEEMRKSNFEDEIKEIYGKYKKTIRWADQDLLNIYFNRHPGVWTCIINLIEIKIVIWEMIFNWSVICINLSQSELLHELSCDFNFRVQHCDCQYAGFQFF